MTPTSGHSGSPRPVSAVHGLSREQLYRSFSADGHLTLRTTLAVMKALGVELSAKPSVGH